jgi:endonuclease/exonuclease/phosphatase family metal-dependent hydrolase
VTGRSGLDEGIPGPQDETQPDNTSPEEELPEGALPEEPLTEQPAETVPTQNSDDLSPAEMQTAAGEAQNLQPAPAPTPQPSSSLPVGPVTQPVQTPQSEAARHSRTLQRIVLAVLCALLPPAAILLRRAAVLSLRRRRLQQADANKAVATVFRTAELAARYGHDFVYVCGMRDNYPQVITSKTPIRGMAKILGDENEVIVAHGAGWAQVTAGGRTLNIVTVHTWPHAYAYRAEDQEKSKAENGGDAYRAREVDYICRQTIGDAKDGNWLMMGDFNSISRTDNALYGLPEDSPKFQAQDYIQLHTPYIDIVKRRNPGVVVSTWINTRYDYVFCTPDLLPSVTRAEIVRDDYTNPVKDAAVPSFAHPSDHLPIIVDFTL